MRTTLAIDDDVLAAARELAGVQRCSIGQMVSTLARKSLRAADAQMDSRNGGLLLPIQKDGRVVTSELVKQLEDELP